MRGGIIPTPYSPLPTRRFATIRGGLIATPYSLLPTRPFAAAPSNVAHSRDQEVRRVPLSPALARPGARRLGARVRRALIPCAGPTPRLRAQSERRLGRRPRRLQAARLGLGPDHGRP